MSNKLLKYPKTVEENLRFRASLLREAEDNITLQSVCKELCRRDRLFFYNVFAWTYDPRTEARHLPFITYQYQDEIIKWDALCSLAQRDNLVEKSRDMGATWIFTVNDVHDWLFQTSMMDILWGSRKEEYVDSRGDMKSIFEKIRYTLRYLPDWMLPRDFSWRKHDNHMRIKNPQTGSTLTGESTNDSFGRGDRKYRIRFDEFAFWDCDKRAWEGCADTTNCRTALSTPNGSSNHYARIRHDKSIQISIKTLHWTLHPDKSKGAYYMSDGNQIPIDDSNRAFAMWKEGIEVRSPWYDAECKRRKPDMVAQELDIDYLKSGRPYFDLKALKLQKEWRVLQRENTGDPVPYGRYVMVDIKEDNRGVRPVEGHNGWVRVFEYPQPGHLYVVSDDISEGLDKGDESFCVVRDRYTRNVVAAFNGLYKPEEVAYRSWLLERMYFNAINAPENNNHGYSVCKDLENLGSNLYYYTDQDKENSPPKRGFSTTGKTRPVMLSRLEEEIRMYSFEVRCPVLIGQCGTFVNKKGKPQADGDMLDDGVMSLAINGYVLDENPYRSSKGAASARRKSMVRKVRGKKNGGMKFSAKKG